MKRLLPLLAATLCCASILEAQQAESKILSRKPIMNVISRTRLPNACGAQHVEACTAFAGQTLTCRCEQRDGAWTITARAQFIPVMYIINGQHLAHERDHIEDIESSLANYLDALEQRRFATAFDCEQIATAETSRFARTMDGFKLESNQERHARDGRVITPRRP